MEKVTISDSSPLISLASIAEFDLLRLFFKEIYIPEAVYQEVVIQGQGRFGQKEVEEADWIRIVAVKDKDDVQRLINRHRIDTGEAETLCLAQELKARNVVLDEIAARKHAENCGFRVIGTLGILKLAQGKGIIEDLKGRLEELESKGFRLSPNLYEDMLKTNRYNT
ncbi:MAG: DUF3368 domain-containing protein [Nitrospirae bacterium]|nr:DUF3368 domain-containing protein [Nitrospirota bacterium]